MTSLVFFVGDTAELAARAIAAIADMTLGSDLLIESPADIKSAWMALGDFGIVVKDFLDGQLWPYFPTASVKSVSTTTLAKINCHAPGYRLLKGQVWSLV